jgi:hypothetical protein
MILVYDIDLRTEISFPSTPVTVRRAYIIFAVFCVLIDILYVSTSANTTL